MLHGMETIERYLSYGLPVCEFRDANLNHVIVSQSSIIGDYDDAFERPGSSALWLSCHGSSEEEGEVEAAHLSREQVAGLIVILQRWLDSGCIHENQPSDVS